MGYRLAVDQVGGTLSYYGTKLYGYVEDETALKSYKFLRDNGYFDDDDILFTYGASHDTVMDVCEFRKFAMLYNEDLNEYCEEKDFFINDETIKKVFSIRRLRQSCNILVLKEELKQWH